MTKKLATIICAALLAGCALAQRHFELLPWPSETSFLYGEGDLDMRSQEGRFSGSFILKMVYPNMLFLEVYGPFGQTLAHLTKEDGHFLLIYGEEKSTDERLLVDRFGFTLNELMDDLASKGERRNTPEGLVAVRGPYRVVYGNDRRGRRTICWERADGRLCLTFTQISFTDR